MRVPADSLMLASANLAAIGLAYLGGITGVPYFDFGSGLNDLLMLASPVLLLATVVYMPRDLMRRDTRLQGLAALVLSIPGLMLVNLWFREIVML